jgi:hypothetical protein
MTRPFSYERILRTAWDRTLGAWPLLLVQGGFAIATWVIFFGAIIAAVVPLVLRLQKEHPGMSLKDFQASELGSLFSPAVLGGFLVLAGLFFAWMFLIGLFIKGGTYGRLWNQVREGAFSFKGFMADGVTLFPRFMLYQCVALAGWLLLAAPAFGVGVVGAILAKGGHGVGALLMIVLGLGFLLLVLVPAMVVLASYLLYVLAHLSRVDGVMDSFRRGWATLKATEWRGLKLMGSVLVVTVVGMIVFAGVFEILNLIPILKWFVMIPRLLFNLGVGALWAVFMPALSIAYLHETEPEAK